MAVHAFIPRLKRQRQVNLCEFKASMLYRASSRIAGATQRNHISKKKMNKNISLGMDPPSFTLVKSSIINKFYTKEKNVKTKNRMGSSLVSPLFILTTP